MKSIDRYRLIAALPILHAAFYSFVQGVSFSSASDREAETTWRVLHIIEDPTSLLTHERGGWLNTVLG